MLLLGASAGAGKGLTAVSALARADRPPARRRVARPSAHRIDLGLLTTQPWHHIVGGGGNVLLYRRDGTAVVGTLDGRGFIPVEISTDLAQNDGVAVGGPDGLVLMLRNRRPIERDGMAVMGVLVDDQWTY